MKWQARRAAPGVGALAVFRQEDFPAERVCADGMDAEIRLITCGAYSERTGCDGNVVASGRLVAVR
ncbi:hypothetical protein [Streptomyces sp. NPDC018833]|uniref:hypothetical protein n=1 Tax=Streptomyces sp. NPDC018833 TaxID=3365053 RepID=UPI0037959BFF